MEGRPGEMSPALVVAGLYVSDAAGASAAALGALGVTHVVNVTVDARMPPCEPPLVGLHVPVPDDLAAPLHEHLEGAASFIDAALSTPGGRRPVRSCFIGASCLGLHRIPALPSA